MKESKLLKAVTDRQLPDMEAVKKACGEQKTSKPKILSLKPSRLIAVAVIAAIAVTGMVAAFASQGGKLFFGTPATEPSASVAESTSKTKSGKEKAKSSSQSSVENYTEYSSKSQGQKNKNAKSEETSESLYKDYLRDYEYDVSWTSFVGNVDDYAICFAGNSGTSSYTCDYTMGGYTFSTPVQQHPYGLGIYVVNKGLCCTLSEAYEMKVFQSFDDAVNLISQSGKSGEYSVSIQNNDIEHSALSEYFGIQKASHFVKLGSGEGYSLYYRVSGTYTGDSGYKLVIGDMTFDMTDSQKRYDPGLYVVSGGEVYTMTQAINEGISPDTRELGDMISSASNDIPFNWTFSRTDETFETTEE